MTLQIYRLNKKRDALLAKVQRLSGERPDATSDVEKSFHLGMVGGSGHNVGKLNRTRERCLDRCIDQAVGYIAARKDLAWTEAQIHAAETAPARAEAKARAIANMDARGRAASATIKPGDMVTWIVTGGSLKVIRVNKSSVTVEMGAGVERLKFDEVRA